MRAIFVGNFENDTRQSDLERLFSKFGKVDRVDMKTGMILYVDFVRLFRNARAEKKFCSFCLAPLSLCLI